MDYEEALLQVTDVLKAHNRYHMNAPDHEKAVNAIRDIVTPKGNWIKNEFGYECSECSVTSVFWGDKPHTYCHWCGTKMSDTVQI